MEVLLTEASAGSTPAASLKRSAFALHLLSFCSAASAGSTPAASLKRPGEGVIGAAAGRIRGVYPRGLIEARPA